MNPDTLSANVKAACSLLKLHGGACSVEQGHKFHRAFKALNEAGLVDITPSATAGFVDVRIWNFVSKLTAPKIGLDD
jgi:hypothetical protein